MMNFKKKNLLPHKRDGRSNPHRFWISCMTAFLVFFIIELVGFTYLFVLTQRRLDIVVAPKLETNDSDITRIENSLQKTEAAVSARTGNEAPSQNTAPIVQ